MLHYNRPCLKARCCTTSWTAKCKIIANYANKGAAKLWQKLCQFL